MIKINKIAIGNETEAFIERNLQDGVNIIYSNDNNRGKTILIQGLMYSLGNKPAFPASFDNENCYFYSKITSPIFLPASDRLQLVLKLEILCQKVSHVME